MKPAAPTLSARAPLPKTAPPRTIGLWTAALIVVANIVGAGVFTTTGYMADQIQSEAALLMVWVVGGVLALCGALSYGELASAFPRSGGEYNYLSAVFHPALGFLSGFVSLIVGFSAPIAANGLVIGGTLATLFGMPEVEGGGTRAVLVRAIAFVVVGALTFMHAYDIKKGAFVQNAFTVGKVVLILAFIGVGLMAEPGKGNRFSLVPSGGDWDLIFSTAFAVNLVFVYFAYSGWNAAAYLTSEIRNPNRTVPLALLAGTGTVMVLYILINYVFLSVAAPAEIAGRGDFATVVADKIFGTHVGQIMASLVAFALLSSTSSMVMAGPRVTATIGEDFPVFRALARRNRRSAPSLALGLQFAVAGAMIMYGDVMVIFTYIGFTLSIFAFLTVLGLFINRFRHGPPAGYRTPGYPLPPLLFLLIAGWLIVWSLTNDRPTDLGVLGQWATGLVVLLAGTLTLGFGLAIYFFSAKGVAVQTHIPPDAEPGSRQ